MSGPPSPVDDPLGAARRAGDHLRGLLPERPLAAVVLGSGLSAAADAFGPWTARVPYGELPGFTPAGAPGHRGELLAGRAGSRSVLVLAGRSHLYEGCHPHQVVHPVRAAVAAGCGTVVLTNAAGAVAAGLAAGDLVAIADHLDLTGAPSPLVGLSPPAFVDQSGLWDPGLRRAAGALHRGLAEGVYAGLRGPQFETPAEIRMLRTLGADLVGMSTVHEALAARHLGATVFGLSVVTNAAAGTGGPPPGGAGGPVTIDAGAILAVARGRAGAVGALLRDLLAGDV